MTYDEMAGWYGQEALDLAGYPGPETRIVTCAPCDGTGEWETMRRPPWGSLSEKCRHCDGTGEAEIKSEPVTLQDLEDVWEAS
jgi:hypothetical protein